jgi:hypothetical protein
MSNNSIINSLKRLERVGSETSIVTQKLRESASELAEVVIDKLEMLGDRENTAIMGWRVRKVRSNVATRYFLVTGDDYDEEFIHNSADSYYMHGDFNCWIPGCKRDTVLKFAKDVKNGLLDELAEALEEQKEEAKKALKKIEKRK